jgi:3-oxoacyl-[acyl-carrier protein] reductase
VAASEADFAVAVVTDGATGHGLDIIRRLTRHGHVVALTYLHDQAAVETILAAGEAALAIRADVSDAVDVERIFDETITTFGGVDLVVVTATRGTSVVNREAARRLRHGGAIFNRSGSEAISPELADAFRARSITVNGLAPGADDALAAFLEECRNRPGQ